MPDRIDPGHKRKRSRLSLMAKLGFFGGLAGGLLGLSMFLGSIFIDAIDTSAFVGMLGIVVLGLSAAVGMLGAFVWLFANSGRIVRYQVAEKIEVAKDVIESLEEQR